MKWKMMEQLEGLEYADDICLMSHTHRDAQEKLERLRRYAGLIGLK